MDSLLPPPFATHEPIATSIESGYFVFTLMPSLFCHLRCPHCYLSLEQRQNRAIMSVEDIELACWKVDAYWDARGTTKRTVVLYWYGGEPTSMGVDMFEAMADAIERVFVPEKGYAVKHVVLSALVSAKPEWFDVLKRRCGGLVQSSYDGTMRGEAYLGKWERKMRAARAVGLKTATISVVNRALIEDGPEATLDRLEALGVEETSFLPFMLNDQNQATGKYGEFAPTMREWSAFMIAMTKHWMARRAAGGRPPRIGQAYFILAQSDRGGLANIAAQTLFLLPDGSFVLPDYRDGWREYMRPFGNVLEQDFAAILTSPERRDYLRRQVRRNGNADCLACPRADCCVMEFWKPNREGDDCFGGRDYVEWVLANRSALLEGEGTGEICLH